jgi:hypothetical protein
MPKPFFPANPQYPTVVKAMVESILTYIAYNCFPFEGFQDIVKTIRERTYLADIEAGSDTVVQQATRFFSQTNMKFPFTAYNVGNREVIREKSNLYSSGGFNFVEGLGYCHAIPCKIEIPLITFFNRAEDYNIAFSNFINDAAFLTRLKVPIQINGQDTAFVVDIEYSALAKGAYASNFQEWLRVNNIWDIQHTATVKYYEYMFTGEGPGLDFFPGRTVFGIFVSERAAYGLVDPGNMLLNLTTLDQDQEILFQENFSIPNTPEILSTTPTSGATSIAVNAPITIVFSEGMAEQTVEASISYSPHISANYSWSTDSKTLTITPSLDLLNNQLYTILISTQAKDKYNSEIENDFAFTFTTVP